MLFPKPNVILVLMGLAQCEVEHLPMGIFLSENIDHRVCSQTKLIAQFMNVNYNFYHTNCFEFGYM